MGSFWLFVVLMILLVDLRVGLLPMYGYSRGWGHDPSGVGGVVLLGLIASMWSGAIAFAWPWRAPVYPS